MRDGPQDFTPAQAYREPPHNTEAEQGLLGSLLLNNKVFEVVAPIISVDDLFEVAHRQIYDVASALIASGRAATPVTLKAYFAEQTFDDRTLDVPAYLATLVAQHAMPIMAKDYAQEIHDLAVRRKIISAAQEVQEQAYDLPASIRPAQMAGEAISTLHAIAGAEGAANTRRETHASFNGVLEEIKSIKSGAVKKLVVTTGFTALDKLTHGYQPGALWVIGARPSMGKTTLAVTSANKTAKAGNGCLLFSLEVPDEQIKARLYADLAFDNRQPISFGQIMDGDIDDSAMWLLEDARDRAEHQPLVFDVSSRLTPAEIRVRVRAEKDRMASKGHILRVVFIDYLKQIDPGSRYAGQRVYEIGQITYSLKQLAKDEGLCVVLLEQLNRSLEGREDKRPGLADLRESGDIENDADVVAFVHREAYYIQRSPGYKSGTDHEALARFIDEQNKAEIILGKNRIGEIGTVHLFCNMACSTMSGLSHHPDQDWHR